MAEKNWFHQGEIIPITGVFQGPPCRDVMFSYMSQWKSNGYLLHIGDYTTLFLGDYDKIDKPL